MLAWITARSYLLLFSAVGAVAIDYGSYWFAWRHSDTQRLRYQRSDSL